MGDGNAYVADASNHTIRKITPAGVVTTLAGTAESSGSADGTGADARFYYPEGVAVDGDGNVYVTDKDNHTIRKITPAGVVTTLAGTAESSGSADGTGADARFTSPHGVAVDGDGNVYVADRSNHMIRMITPAGWSPRWPAPPSRLGRLMGPAPTPASTNRPGWRLMGTATSTSPTTTTRRFARSHRPEWSPRWPAQPGHGGRMMGPAPTPASKTRKGWRLMGTATSTSPTARMRFARSRRPVWSPHGPAPLQRVDL